MMRNKLAQPFVKWAGGKRRLFSEIQKYIPKKINTYYEPFLGGGAVLFNLQPKKAIVNDSNSDLINVYKIIKDDVDSLINTLRTYKCESNYYYEVRELDRRKKFQKLSKVKKAARIIYLNKTCYNGLFRVNSQGQFNVPFGKYKNPEIVNEVILRAVSNYLNESSVIFLNKDFTESIKNIKKGSFVYFDPPYDPVSDTSSFTGYTLNGFKKNDQVSLKKLCEKLDKKGCKFLLSNSSTDFILDLYKKFSIKIVHSNRSINSIASKRGKVEEVLVRNYEVDDDK